MCTVVVCKDSYFVDITTCLVSYVGALRESLKQYSFFMDCAITDIAKITISTATSISPVALHRPTKPYVAKLHGTYNTKIKFFLLEKLTFGQGQQCTLGHLNCIDLCIVCSEIGTYGFRSMLQSNSSIR